MSSGLRRQSSSAGEVTVTVGTIADGAAPAGTVAAGNGGAAAAGVVRQDGTDGEGQAVQWLVRLGQAGRRAGSAPGRSRSRSPAERNGSLSVFRTDRRGCYA